MQQSGNNVLLKLKTLSCRRRTELRYVSHSTCCKQRLALSF